MAPPKKQKSISTLQPQDIRRRYIYRQMMNCQHVSADDICEALNHERPDEIITAVNRPSISKDIAFWEKTLGWEIETVKGAHGKEYWHRVDCKNRYHSGEAMSKKTRDLHCQSEKRAIAEFSVGLLIGSGSEEEIFVNYKCRGGVFEWGGTLTAVYRYVHEDEIIEPHLKASILSKLELYGKARVRNAFLDASTTVNKIVDKVKNLRFPIEVQRGAGDPDGGIVYDSKIQAYRRKVPSTQNLEVWTNNRFIFNELGDPKVSIRAITLPGWQDPDNESLCSYLATDFVERVDPHFGIAMIGAKSLDLLNGYFCTDHAADAKLIGQIIERSEIVVILADSSKLKTRPFGPDKRCCRLIGNVDYVIVDTIDEDDRNMVNLVKDLRRNGVIFLSASEFETLHQARNADYS